MSIFYDFKHWQYDMEMRYETFGELVTFPNYLLTDPESFDTNIIVERAQIVFQWVNNASDGF